jgi:DMSO/TMAO reductase YedYZ molybdopterin-dependent catalytic subunit
MPDSSARPRIISPDTLRGGGDRKARTPPAQALSVKWPVLHYGNVPKVDPYSPDWELRIFGACAKPYELSYEEIRAMPAVDVVCDMHCVTHWSRLDNVFTGVPTRLLIDRAQPKQDAKYVM